MPAARRLLGCTLTGGGVTVRLTEVEAYAGLDDPGSHAFRGRTPRTAVMFGPPGRAYVYFSYGMHWCLNVVCGPEGRAAAVLLRAGEVVSGQAAARERRCDAADRELARGPARLARTLGVDGRLNGSDLLGGGPLLLVPGPPVPEALVRRGPRVGLAAAADRPWRFSLAGDPTVSPYRPHTPRRRLRQTGTP